MAALKWRFWRRGDEPSVRDHDGGAREACQSRGDDRGGADAKTRGLCAEDRAVEFLIKKSFGILARNYRIPSGELDIVALEKNTLVFVEVKFLQSAKMYAPEEQVTRAKRRRCEKAAKVWMQKNPHFGDCRFDVIAMVASGRGGWEEILHFEDAWEEGE